MADTLEDILIRHSSLLQRLVPASAAVVIRDIDSDNEKLYGTISMWLDKNPSYKLTLKQQQQLQVLQNKIDSIRGGAITQAGINYEKEMVKLAVAEQSFVSTGIESLGAKSLVMPALSSVKKMVERTPIDGKIITKYYKDLSTADTKRVIDGVTAGLKGGLTKAQIQTAIFGTEKLNYTDGILDSTRKAVNNPTSNSGIVRTTINGIQNEAHSQLYQANSDIIPHEMVVSVLDGRTTFYCADQDGNVYKLGEGPSFPAHPNCRTIRVPEIDGIDIRSTRPYVRDTRTRKERESDFREVKRDTGDTLKLQRAKWAKQRVGMVPDDTKYTGWFDNGTVAYQKDYLGATRYKLYKDGGMSIGDFATPTAKQYNLNQLYERDKEAFKRAGIAKPN